jgi:RNA polymerase sigma factor (sigma-70 family)
MDRALINSIRAGDELAFRQAYDLFHEKLYAWFLLKTKSADVSKELVQLTFIKLWRFRNTLNATLSLSRQIFRIAKTSLIDILRQHAVSRTVPLQAIEQTDSSSVMVALPADDDQLTAVLESLAHLPPMRRRIIRFRLEGLSNKEIADSLSISKKTVENQVNRAVREIRKMNEPASLLLLLLSGPEMFL